MTNPKGLSEQDANIPELEAALKTAKQEGRSTEVQDLLSRLGQAYQASGEDSLARDYYGEALITAMRLRDEHAQAHLLGSIAEIHASKGQVGEAIRAAERALTMMDPTLDRKQIGELGMLLAAAYQDLDDYETAFEYCRAAAISFNKIGNQELANQALALLNELGSPT